MPRNILGLFEMTGIFPMLSPEFEPITRQLENPTFQVIATLVSLYDIKLSTLGVTKFDTSIDHSAFTNGI
jgi:hypothetical protein